MAASAESRANAPDFSLNDDHRAAIAAFAKTDWSSLTRESLPELLKVLGFTVGVFGSAEEFLESGDVDRTRCLILDVTMPGLSGPELQRDLLRSGRVSRGKACLHLRFVHQPNFTELAGRGLADPRHHRSVRGASAVRGVQGARCGLRSDAHQTALGRDGFSCPRS